MADYELDWSAGTNLDGGPNAIAGTSVTASVSTPSNSQPGGEFFYDSGLDVLKSSYPDENTGSEFSVDFSTEVTNVEFELFDVDMSEGNWGETVEIFAYDANGNRLDVEFSGLDGQTTTDYTITGGQTLNNLPVTVNILGEVATIRVVFEGAGGDEPGVLRVGNIGFDEVEIVCFARGTFIETDRGEVRVEDLQAGDRVRTLDHGMQSIRWIGCATVKAEGRLAPVLIRKGALGNTQDLLVSPAHRMMLQDWQLELLFDSGEMLVAAQDLVNDSSIIRQVGGQVDYFHILFDHHEIIFANGIPSESFHPGEAGISHMALKAREELYELFPALATQDAGFGPAARKTLRPHEAALLGV